MSPRRVRVVVSGRVQGVFFRAATQQEARGLGLTGWVRNLPSGQVEAVFEGEKETLERMLSWCRQGPPHARVTEVETVWEDYQGSFTGFEIKYG